MLTSTGRDFALSAIAAQPSPSAAAMPSQIRNLRFEVAIDATSD